MTFSTNAQNYGGSDSSGSSKWATGILVFAAALMMVNGFFHLLQGIAALLDDGYLSAAATYAYDLDLDGWGALHLIGGVALILTGIGLLSGAVWARVLALFVLVVSCMINFVYIPYEPVWSIIQLAMDGVIIWAIIAAPDFKDQTS